MISDIGAFGGMFACNFQDMQSPVLVSSTDGVGTKLKVAMMMNRHNTVGADLVNHCVNDILVQGARPLFFLDYIATGKLDPDVIVSVVEGVASGCKDAGCALIGGETAEMPGFYADGEYDVAGFIVGVVDKPKIIDGKSIRHGDVLIGLPSVWPAYEWLLSGAQGVFRNRRASAGFAVSTGSMTRSVRRCCKPHINYEPLLRRQSPKDSSKAWRTSQAAASPRISIGFFRRAARRRFSWDRGRYCPSSE